MVSKNISVEFTTDGERIEVSRARIRCDGRLKLNRLVHARWPGDGKWYEARIINVKSTPTIRRKKWRPFVSPFPRSPLMNRNMSIPTMKKSKCMKKLITSRYRKLDFSTKNTIRLIRPLPSMWNESDRDDRSDETTYMRYSCSPGGDVVTEGNSSDESTCINDGCSPEGDVVGEGIREKARSSRSQPSKGKKKQMKKCPCCLKEQTALYRHVNLKHGGETLVQALTTSTDRIYRQGIFNKINGLSVQLQNIGATETVATARGVKKIKDSAICSNCGIYFAKRSFYGHKKRCIGAVRPPVHLDVRMLEGDEDEMFQKYLRCMRDDEVSHVCRTDETIRLFGNLLFQKKKIILKRNKMLKKT